MARFVGRHNVRKRLEPLGGEPGRTVYADGSARVETEVEVVVVRPPFGLAREGEFDRVELAPLFEALAADPRRGRATRAAGRLRRRGLRGRAPPRLEGRKPLRQGPSQEGRLVREPLPATARGAGAGVH